MSTKRVKVAVTGAAGNIGYALIFRLASGQVFGQDVTVDLHLIEIEPALPALKGVKMELEDCAFPLLGEVVCTSDLSVGMRDVNWVVLIGAVPRRAGMERADLLQINGGIFTTQGKAINDYASLDVRVLVVGNPCNTNCLIAMNHAPDIPSDRWFAMTMLDQNRAVTQLALKAGVAVTAVSDMIIWGNHSSTQYPDFYHATINGRRVPEVIVDEQWLHEAFIPLVQKRGAAVIEARGASSAASAANAIVDTLYHLTHDCDGQLFSVGLCANGEYGFDAGLIASQPCRTKNGVVSVETGWKHEAFGLEKLRVTADELRHEKETVAQLKLI